MHLTLLKQTPFSLYDMNSDGAVCEYDLFSIIRHTDNKMFAKAITQDLRDIQACMSKRDNDFLDVEGANLSFNEEKTEI